jgi:hypothetical protein
VRGGGGGFTNQEIADFLNDAAADASPEKLAKELIRMVGPLKRTDSPRNRLN